MSVRETSPELIDITDRAAQLDAAATNAPIRSVAIWGSCVTRDAFAVTERSNDLEGLPLAYYGARSSWISQASEPINISDAELGSLSGFARRMVNEDLARSIPDRLVESQPDVVIFDLIDERLTLKDYHGRWFTDSEYTQKSDALALHDATLPVLGMSSPRKVELFTAAVAHLAPRLLTALPDTTFVLHRAPYLTQISNGVELPEPSRGWALELQAAQQPLFKAMRKGFRSRLIELEAPTQVQVLDPNHRWGLASYHYDTSYYHWLIDTLLHLEDYRAEKPPRWHAAWNRVRSAVTAS